MIIKALLISCVVLIALWFLINRAKAHARAGVRLITITFAIVAIFAILFPQATNSAANAVGVGRGADLVLYLLTTLFLFFVLSYYIRSGEEQRRIVILARKLAILEANELKHNKQVGKDR